MKKIIFTMFIFFTLVSIACSVSFDAPQIVRGSGVVVSETRSVGEFTAIELAGSADVDVSFGDTQSVVIEAEDNILPLIETTVSGSKLAIKTRPNTTFSATKLVRVVVTMKSVDSASISGSGNVDIAGLRAQDMKINLSGSGNITVSGAADTLNVDLSGSGNIMCGDLQSKSVTVKIGGSGNATVFASERLDATVSGSGSVMYRGNPAQVNKSVPGSGSINAMP